VQKNKAEQTKALAAIEILGVTLGEVFLEKGRHFFS
jgi:hypothetical protein